MVGHKHDKHYEAAHRPSLPPGTTTRDIHVSEEGQSEVAEGEGPTRIAVWRPIPGKYTVKPDPPFSDDQQAMLHELKEFTESHLVLRQSDEDYEEYAKWEKRFLQSPDTYPRYMRASGWKLEEAKRRMQDSLRWRREYRPDLIKPSEIAVEAEGGKVYVNGFDNEGRPIIWMRPSRENTKPSPLQIRHLIFHLERAIDIMPSGVTKVALVVDYYGATSQNNPSLDTAKQVIHILQNHYCERLGRGIVINVPWYLAGFFKVLQPFLDPRTRDKIKFNPHLTELIPKQQLDVEFGGTHEYIYDSRVYLPAISHYCGVKDDGTREDSAPKDDPDHTRPTQKQRTLTAQTLHSNKTADEERRRREAEEAEIAAVAAKEGTHKTDEEIHALHADDLVNSNTTDEAYSKLMSAPNQPVDPSDPEHRNRQEIASQVALAAAGLTGVAAASHHAAKGSKQEETPPAAEPGTIPNSTAATAPSTTQSSVPAPAATPSAAPSAAPVVDSTTAPVALTSIGTGNAQPEVIKSSPAAAQAATTKPAVTSPPSAATATTEKRVDGGKAGKARGGWKLFSSKRGLDKAGNPTVYRHKHSVKAFCMHKGAINPNTSRKTEKASTIVKEKSAIPADTHTSSEPASTEGLPKIVNGTSGLSSHGDLPAEPGKGRVKIAADANASKDYNIPLATNATFGTDAYHTAMEAPIMTGATRESIDYFSGNLTHRQVPVNNKPDQAKLVSRESQLERQLHTPGDADENLTLAYQVKKTVETDEPALAYKVKVAPTEQ